MSALADRSASSRSGSVAPRRRVYLLVCLYRIAAGITLMRGDPQLVAAALDISHRTVLKIRQNLFWAFAYNVAGIPLAALGYLNPVVAGAAMALSSVSVMTNALLLKRWRRTGS